MILDVKEAAKVFPCSEREVYELIRRKQLEGTYYRIGRRVFFNSDKLDEWKANGGSAQFDETA